MIMHEEYNAARPMVMHIDLNSCFATVEQQARVMLRGKPVAIMNRRTEHTMIVTCSYEAKAKGVKLGMRFRDAKKLCPDLVGLESDPPKYRFVYHQLMDIMRDYSPHFRMKSIDEGVIDFALSPALIRDRDLVEIGQEIKQRLRDEIGIAMRCNVGIAPNRFLAKMAASLHKPDGLDVITHENLRDVYDTLELTDLTGIARANEHRLNQVGIYTPLQFLDADSETLQKVVFKSINGLQWHQRLRGWEVDDVDYDLKSCGRQYVLESRNLSRTEIAQRLHHLTEAVGTKLRSQGKCARGVGVYARFYNDTPLATTQTRWGRAGHYWHEKMMTPLPFFSDQSIWAITERLFLHAPEGAIREIGIHCYQLEDGLGPQLSLFADQLMHEQQVTIAVDDINKRYGERTIHSADTLGTGIYVRTKIPFGSTRYL
jgi:DNA polymerase-4